MHWIKITEYKKPKKGDLVNVLGNLYTDMSGLSPKQSIGLVIWDSEENSECSDTCVHSMNYRNITHFSIINMP